MSNSSRKWKRKDRCRSRSSSTASKRTPSCATPHVCQRSPPRGIVGPRADAASVDAIVNTIGFPLVGGPAGSMEAGRGVAEGLLGSMDVPYYVAAPLLLQDMASWRQSGVTGLQSVVLYALPELDGAVDAVVLGALEGDDIVLSKNVLEAL